MEIKLSKKSCYDHGAVLTNSEKGLSCHGWLSTKYSQLGSTRPWPPNSLASEFKATLYLSITVKLQSSENPLSQFAIWETWLSSLTLEALSKSQSQPACHQTHPYYSGVDWFGWTVSIKSKILITAGMVWPASSEGWKAQAEQAYPRRVWRARQARRIKERKK